MKKSLLCLLALLLTGCGTAERIAPAGEMAWPESPLAAQEMEEGGFSLSAEREEYDPSVGTIWYVLEDHSGEGAMTGREVQLETLGENGRWYRLPLAEDAAWTMEGLVVPEGGRIALSCGLGMFGRELPSGTYRLVKEVAGQTCTAEFRVREGAAVSAAEPYGFAPLEALPETYGADTAAGEDVVYTDEGVRNGEAVAAFLEKVRLGIPCQLRTVQDYGENAHVVIDVLFQQEHFCQRMRQGREIVEERYSYVVTDGRDLYLSNGADWGTAERFADKELAFLLPPETAPQAAVSIAAEMTAERSAASTVRYRIWSDDGAWDAGLLGGDAFTVGYRGPDGSWGRAYSLDRWAAGAILHSLDWQGDGQLVLVCETAEGAGVRLVFDPETETMTEG